MPVLIKIATARATGANISDVVTQAPVHIASRNGTTMWEERGRPDTDAKPGDAALTALQAVIPKIGSLGALAEVTHTSPDCIRSSGEQLRRTCAGITVCKQLASEDMA